jgi:hypothetical protein
MRIQEITDLIDQAINPIGGDPKIKGPGLNSLLKMMSAEFYAGNGSIPSPTDDFSSPEPGLLRLDTSTKKFLVDLNQPFTEQAKSSGLVNTPDFSGDLNGGGQPGSFDDYGGWSIVGRQLVGDDASALQLCISVQTAGNYELRMTVDEFTGDVLMIYGLVNGIVDKAGAFVFPFYSEVGYQYFYFFPQAGPVHVKLSMIDVFVPAQDKYFLGNAFENVSLNSEANHLIFSSRNGNKELDISSLINPIPVTYQDLVNLRNQYALQTGRQYRITDWQLTHTIPGTSELARGPLEQLIVTATSPNAIGGEGSSLTYPKDIIYYSLDNTSRMPGATKGFIYRRIDPLQGNDIEIDFRNVVFRRWKTSIAPAMAIIGTSEGFWSGTDTGKGYQDFPMFDPTFYSLVRNNRWSGFDLRYSPSIFGNINFVQQDNSPVVNTCLLNNSKILNFTVASGSWLFNSSLINSTLNDTAVIKTQVFTFLSVSMIDSTMRNKNVLNREVYNTLISSTNTTAIDSKVIIGNVDSTIYTPQVVNTSSKSAVTAGTFSNGELQGMQPPGSIIGMKFVDATYAYEYRLGMNDTDGTQYVWCRTLKG